MRAGEHVARALIDFLILGAYIRDRVSPRRIRGALPIDACAAGTRSSARFGATTREEAVAMTGRETLEAIRADTDSLACQDDGALMIDGCGVDGLLDEFGSPLYVISERTLRSNYRAAAAAFGARWPAGVNVLYAIKANNNFAVRAILDDEGAGGDCFGDGELYATFMGGADPDRIVLNGSNKGREHLRTAVRLGVRINVDAEEELDRIKEVAADEGTVARINLRVKVLPPEYDELPVWNVGIAGANFNEQQSRDQWGMDLDTVEALIERAQGSPQVELGGYHVHIGHIVQKRWQDRDVWRAWARGLGELVVGLYRRTGFAPMLLDVGGGHPGTRDPYSLSLELNENTIEDYAEVVTAELLAALAQEQLEVPDLWLEPGRYIAGNAGVLLTRVETIKAAGGNTLVHVDASINNLMRIETLKARHSLLPASRMDAPAEWIADVVGSLCTGAPLGEARELPRLERGDVIAILDAGAYAETPSTQFNGVPRPATVLVNDGTAELIKERETVADVFARQRIPERLRPASRGRAEWPAAADQIGPAAR
jgi:diaminopimelate decarboxylase